ncbi:MAG: UvrD-helicase domain-containing protein [Candidatus Paceibacterota bacterium]|jgi:DNA helicase-2/ATP-dependent DNA helicase PcrA
MTRLDSLNPAQKEAVLHTEGPLLIVAGAGAGKTKTITERIVHLISKGVAGNAILAVTFTNKAAAEMRERVLGALGNPDRNEAPLISTFHSLGVRLIRENSRAIGVTQNFTITDESDGISYVKEALKELGLDPKQYEPRKIRSIISREKGNFTTQGEFAGKAQTYLEKIVANVWQRYETSLKKENSLDFDDLLLKTVLLLEEHADIRAHYQNLWKYIHIDEYQDTNHVQYKMARLLAEGHGNICVVGDSDQNIYSWRGANIKNILNFEEDYKGAKVVLLEQNYRSTKNILDAANEIIKKNVVRKEKNLFTDKGYGEPITIMETYDETGEANFVAEKSSELIGSGISASEIAVLYRANFQSRVLEEAFLGMGVPYQILGVRFFERKEIKDVLCYLRAASNPDSLSDIKRIINVPVRGIGKVTIAKLFAGERENLPHTMQKKIAQFYDLLESIKNEIENNLPSFVIKHIITASGLEKSLKESGTEEDLERLENMKELVTLALKYDVLPQGEGVQKLLEDAALASDQDSLLEAEGKKGEAVRLMTVHSSKGLEFSHVFVVGLEQDLFPHKRMDKAMTLEAGEEERRLFYVALTRAKEKLFLSWASLRTIFGSRQINAPSEFIYDIPERLADYEKKSRDGGKIIMID